MHIHIEDKIIKKCTTSGYEEIFSRLFVLEIDLFLDHMFIHQKSEWHFALRKATDRRFKKSIDSVERYFINSACCVQLL